MKTEKEKMEEFTKYLEPVMEYLSNNYHPHTKVIIECNRAEIVEGVATHITDKFIKD